MTACSEVARLINSTRFNFCSEKDLQDGIEQVLQAAGFAYRREYELSPADRIDFMVGRIGLEVKIGGATTSVLRQLARYATHVDSLILVTSRSQHSVPSTVGGVSLTIVKLRSGL